MVVYQSGLPEDWMLEQTSNANKVLINPGTFIDV